MTIAMTIEEVTVAEAAHKEVDIHHEMIQTMMMIVVEDQKEEDGTVIQKATPKQHNVAGVEVAAAVQAATMMMIMEEVVVPVLPETEEDGTEILKVIQKLLSADGNIVQVVAAAVQVVAAVAEAIAVVVMTAVQEEVLEGVLVTHEEDKVMADGLVIQKDIQKQLKWDGNIAVAEALAVEEAVAITMMTTEMMIVVAQEVQEEEVVVVMADGSEILKVIPKQVNADGGIEDKLI